ncbi:hypothetical protein GGR51DRAFT_578047 [Nemania sp. FL0031]|nr:hypothetical protein GGR51DRAFT_578047 [Nemania sp. FL0031]
MSSSEVEIRQMPANAIPQAEKIKIWLLSEDADFQIVEGIRICKNVEGLAEATWRLGKSFLDEIKACLIQLSYLIAMRDLPDNQDKPSENSVIALHFEKPTIVPCEPGWKIEFIPVYTVKGPVKVAGREVSPNSYAHLTEEERVTGDFYAILLMFKP